MTRATRVLFTLSMPGRASWNGRWSGEDKNYAIVRTLSNNDAAKLFAIEGGHTACKSFSYHWNDGWRASVSARIMLNGERAKKSDGFNGYDWMVDSIIRYGKICAAHERPGEAASS